MKEVELFYYNRKSLEYTNSQTIILSEDVLENVPNHYDNATLTPIPEEISSDHRLIYDKDKDSWLMEKIKTELPQSDSEKNIDKMNQLIDSYIEELKVE